MISSCSCPCTCYEFRLASMLGFLQPRLFLTAIHAPSVSCILSCDDQRAFSVHYGLSTSPPLPIHPRRLLHLDMHHPSTVSYLDLCVSVTRPHAVLPRPPLTTALRSLLASTLPCALPPTPTLTDMALPSDLILTRFPNGPPNFATRTASSAHDLASMVSVCYNFSQAASEVFRNAPLDSMCACILDSHSCVANVMADQAPAVEVHPF